MAITAGVAVAVDRVLYRRLRRTGPVTLLIASVGVALILRNVIQIVWGPQNEGYRQGIEIPYRLPWLDLRIKPTQIAILGVAALFVALVHSFLTRTKTGKAMRAMSDDMELARICGIPTERVVGWTWALGATLAAAAGILLGLETFLRPPMGWNLLLPIFAAVILGGVGSPYGAMLGGLIIGVSQELSTAFFPTEYKPLIAFILMLVILFVRPSGLMGVRTAGRGR